MNRAATYLLVLLSVGCSSLPGARRGSIDPNIALDVLSIDQDQEGAVTATLRLTNRSGRPFSYRGYSLEKPSPLGTTEVWHRLRWRRLMFVDCGTGITTVSLLPGRSVDFPLRVWTRSNERETFTKFRVAIWEDMGTRVARSRSFRVTRTPNLRLHPT